MVCRLYEWNETTGTIFWVYQCTQKELEQYSQLIQDTIPEDVSKMDLLVSFEDLEGEPQVINFNTYCRQHKILSPSQRKSLEEFEAFKAKLKGLFS